MIRWPWVSRALYDAKCEQVEELKESNTQLLALALTKQVEPVKPKEEEETATKPSRLLGADIRRKATLAASERHKKSGK